MAATLAATIALAGCAATPALDEASAGTSSGQETVTGPDSSEEKADAETKDDAPQEENCDWDSPRLDGQAVAPAGQDGDLAQVLIGSWQHTYTDDGSGFEPVVNDHRFVFTSPERMLYCQHVPGATDYAENAADVTLNGTTIELPGGKNNYTVTAWGENTMLWNNPVGGGYVYLLHRR